MAKTTIDDEWVERVANDLNNAVDSTLVPELTSLKAKVDELLGGGLVLEKTSPALLDSYHEFNTSVTKAVDNIKSFSQQFQGIKNAVKDVDARFAGGVRH